MTIFRQFRVLVEAIQDLTASVDGLKSVAAEISVLQRQRAPADERLEELERGRALWEANMQALIVGAKGTYDGARNAENRARTMKRHYENLDPLDREGEGSQEPEAVFNRKMTKQQWI